jgi:hypothetical protein
VNPENTGRNQAGQFKKGKSGNPAGKPSGVRHKATMAVEGLLSGEAEAITRKAIEAALDGDMTAIRLVLDRVAPPSRDRPITADLPGLSTVADAPQLCLEVLRATVEGKITPEESVKLASVVDVYRKVVEAAEFERRIEALEAAQQHANQPPVSR